jgi:serine/threonine protein kinase
MAPEQALARSSEIDHRTDVYALGVVAFEMLTGAVPFSATAFGDLLLQQVYEAPPRPSSLRPELDPAWDELLLRCLAKRREDRFQSMGELGAAVERAAHGAAAAAAAPAPRPPAQVGRYRVHERLGGGGMAEVFRATLTGAEGFQRVYALKRIAPHLSADDSFARMFIEEARLSAQLNHANVVATLDFDRDADGCLYLAMELVEGRDLRQLAATGSLPAGVAAFVTAELLRALDYAHTAIGPGGRPLGIVHRDVSPHNVLVSWDGHVKLSDFGIAKAYAATGASHSGSLRGKVAYMSPEQARGLPLDGRADLFAVGVMLHEMLTGQRLFGGGTDAESFARMLTMEIPPPRSLRAGIPADLEAVAMRLLERDRDRRFASARAALEALLACSALSSRGSTDLAELLRDRAAGRRHAVVADRRRGGLRARSPPRPQARGGGRRRGRRGRGGGRAGDRAPRSGAQLRPGSRRRAPRGAGGRRVAPPSHRRRPGRRPRRRVPGGEAGRRRARGHDQARGPPPAASRRLGDRAARRLARRGRPPALTPIPARLALSARYAPRP